MSELQEATKEFLIESHENLVQLDLDLVTLEKDPHERETLSRAFRTLHTVKGTAGFLGLEKLQAVAHAAENLLSRLRSGELTFNADIASAMLTAVDAIRKMLDAVEASETDGDEDFSSVIATLDRLRNAVPAKSVAATRADIEKPVAAPQLAPPVSEARSILSRGASILSDHAPGDEAEARAQAVADSTIRVDVGLLDQLMTLVGELVLARNQIVRISAAQESNSLLGTVQRLNLLTTELQAGVMKTRMQPIGSIWNKFPRIVRDLAVACGKQARLEMEGQETELDRTIIEAIRDPLTHIIRNSIDHGLETPDERARRGKPAEGKVAMRAFHEGGKVIIEIADDGGGIDPQRVGAKAVQSKLITPEQAARLSDQELVNLIFLPGFSTSERVTQFSGRGVGMDVVRTNIEKIGGAVTIESRLGRGAKVRMKIPLTLAIIPALTITCAGGRFCIPQVSLLELLRLEGDQAATGIEMIHDAPVYRLRGNLLPLVSLQRLLHPFGSPGQIETPAPSSEINIVVLQADDRQFGLIVDAIHDTEEIVVKPLQKLLKNIGVYAGAAIMGDGKVALILDVLGLAQRSGVVAAVRERALVEHSTGTVEPIKETHDVLLVEGRGSGSSDGTFRGRYGIFLSMVDRLEEFPQYAVERLGPNAMVQYRDTIMPLIDVERELGQSGESLRKPASADDAETETVQVVVIAGPRPVGLVVGRILDIVEESLASRAPAPRPNVLFTAVIDGRITEILDIATMVRAAAAAQIAEPAFAS